MKRAVLLVLVLLVVGGLAAVLLTSSPEPSDAATPTARASGAAVVERPTPIEAVAPERGAIEASESALEAASGAAPQPDARRARTWYRVEFTSAADGQPLRDRVEVVASLADERVSPRFDSESGEFEFVGLRSGRWRLQARAHGYQDFATDVVIDERDATGDRFKLWPLDWILVRVRASEGGGIDALAESLGMETPDVFEGGFRVWRSNEPPADALAPPLTPPHGPEQGVQLASPHYERHRRDPREVARVRRAPQGSTWIGLAFHGRFLGWGQALASDGAVEFELALEDVTAQFGALDLCVVDEASRAPLFNARITLSAETSGLRRADIDKLAPNDQGCAQARPLLPDEYDLRIEAPGYAAHHQRLSIGAGQRVDLGEVALRLAPPLELTVVDAKGAPVLAIVQVGAWREGEWIDDCVTPNATTTDDAGRTTIPTPGVKSVVCARRFSMGANGRPTVQTEPAAVAVFDPKAPVESLRLVIPLEHAVTLEFADELESAATLRVIDASGIAVARTSRWSRTRTLELREGELQARVLDSFGAELARYSFRVPPGGASQPIRLP